MSVTRHLKGSVTDDAVTTQIDGHTLHMGAGHPSPVDHLIASLAGCAGLTLRRILEKRRIDVQSLEIETELRHTLDPYRIEEIQVTLRVRSEKLKTEVLDASIDLTEKHCPVGVALAGAVKIRLRGEQAE